MPCERRRCDHPVARRMPPATRPSRCRRPGAAPDPRCADQVARCQPGGRIPARRPPTAGAPEAACPRPAHAGTRSETRWRMSERAPGLLSAVSTPVPLRWRRDPPIWTRWTRRVSGGRSPPGPRRAPRPREAYGRAHCARRHSGGPVSRSSGSLQASAGTPARFDRAADRAWQDSGRCRDSAALRRASEAQAARTRVR